MGLFWGTYFDPSLVRNFVIANEKVKASSNQSHSALRLNIDPVWRPTSNTVNLSLKKRMNSKRILISGAMLLVLKCFFSLVICPPNWLFTKLFKPRACKGKFTLADNRSLTRGSIVLSHPLSNKMIYQWSSTPQLYLSFTADSIQSPTVVTLMQPFHSLALLARNSVLVVSADRAIFV